MTASDRGSDLLGPLAQPDLAASLITAMLAATETPWALGEDPGLAAFLTPDVAPTDWFQWLARCCGARFDLAFSEAQQRAELNNPVGWTRGTKAAVINAAKLFLTGTQSIAIEERTAADGTADPNHFVLVVRPEEIVDVDQLTAAVDASRPAGVFWTLVEIDAPLLSQYSRLLSAVTVNLAVAALADVV